MSALLRVLLVDDEALARRRLRTLLAADSAIEIIGECQNGADAVRAIRDLAPDLVFLDVQMPELDGFEVIEAVGPEKMPPVIFITAFDDYAVNAFEKGAVDYLLKPVDAIRFARTVERARARIGAKSPDVSEQLTALMRYVSEGSGAGERLGIKVGGKVLFVETDDIFWIQARDDIARIHLAESYHDVREPLSRLESRLPKGRFMRVHRSAIVNTSKIREVEPFDQGDQLMLLTNGKRVTTGRSYRKAVQDFLKQST
jgi:two-component system LytT family response regulator